MERKRTLLVALSFVFGLMLSAPAWAVFHLALVGVANQTRGTDSADAQWEADGLGIGGGALFSTGSSTEFEFGALYVKRNFKQDVRGATTKVDTTGYEFPVGLRYWLAGIFSLGGGLYYLHYADATVVIASDAHPDINVSSRATLNGSDFGAYASAQLRIPLGMVVGLLIDGRYNYGFKRSTGDVTVKAQDLQGLAGLSFAL